jgi:hypothetical protein
MKTFLIVLTTTTFLATLISQAARESPIACDRLALTPEQRKRHFEELDPRLRALITETRELANGYEFQLPGDAATYQLIVEWAAGEHLCCPFLDIDIRLNRDGGPASIRLTGRAGAMEFIKSEFRAMH